MYPVWFLLQLKLLENFFVIEKMMVAPTRHKIEKRKIRLMKRFS
jgi:hypothetical protein